MTRMLLKSLTLSAVLATTGMTANAVAQSTEASPAGPVLAQAMEQPDEYYDEEPEDMNQGRPEQGMPQRMMPQQRMPGQMMPERRGPERMMGPDHMMGGDRMMAMMAGKKVPLILKIFFAIADTDNDGSLTFQEVSAIHKRIFDAIDTNKDGKITLEEIQAFLRN